MGERNVGRSQKKRLDDFMRGQEIKRLKELQEKNQATIDFIKAYSRIAEQTEDYPLTEKVLELKNAVSIDSVNYPDGLVLPDSWAYEFGLK
jgi:aryl-phospho-beta-D-glucosidase BglC (GH1 family)